MIKMSLLSLTRGIGLAGLILAQLSYDATAAGFYVTPKGAAGVGLAGVGTTVLAQDGSTLFSNPAGVTQLKGAFLQVGFDTIKSSVKISNQGSTAAMPGTLGAPVPYTGGSGTAGDWTPVPNVYAASPLLNKDLWFALAVTSPFGLKLDYPSDWFGRYDSTENQLTTLDIAPTVAYRINDLWSIGAGVDFQYADAKLVSALPNTLNPGGPTATTDGTSRATGHDWSVGFNAGALFHSDATRIGVHYRSKIDHTLEGTTSISGLVGPLAGANGHFATSVDLNLPEILSLGIAQEVCAGLTLLGEFQWFGWNRFKEIRFKFTNGNPDIVRSQNYRNAIAIGFGAQYKWSDRWIVRSGVRYEQTPTVDGFRTTGVPDSNVTLVGVGGTYTVNDRLAIDIGYFHAFFQHAVIDLSQSFFAGTPAAGTVNVRGNTDNSGDVLSVALRYWL